MWPKYGKNLKMLDLNVVIKALKMKNIPFKESTKFNIKNIEYVSRLGKTVEMNFINNKLSETWKMFSDGKNYIHKNFVDKTIKKFLFFTRGHALTVQKDCKIGGMNLKYCTLIKHDKLDKVILINRYCRKNTLGRIIFHSVK